MGDGAGPRPDTSVISALRAAIPGLRGEIHLTPHGAPPSGWRCHPAVVGLVELPEDTRRATIEALLTADEEVMLRVVGAHTLMIARHTELIPALIASHEGCADGLLKTMLIAAIGRLAHREETPRVHAALEEPQFFWAAVESLALLDDAASLTALRRAIAERKDDWDRLDILTVLGEVGGEAATVLLIEALGDPAETFGPIHGFAAQALGARRDPRARSPLLKALADPQVEEKGRVLWGLAALGDPAAFDAILPFTRVADKDWWRAEALRALACCDPERAWPRVKQASDEEAFFRDDREGFTAVVQALGFCKAPEALERLLDVLCARRSLPTRGAWPAPTAVIEEGGASLTGITLKALDASLGVELIPRARPDHFTLTALITHSCDALVAHLEATGHPRAAGMASLRA